MSYNCIDRHAKTSPDQKAIIWESTMANKTMFLYLKKDLIPMLSYRNKFLNWL